MTMTLDLGTIMIAIVGALVSIIAYFLKSLASELKEMQKNQAAMGLSLHMTEASMKTIEEKMGKLPDAAIIASKMDAAFLRIDELRDEVNSVRGLLLKGEDIHELLRKRQHRLHSQILELKVAGQNEKWKELTQRHEFWTLDGVDND